MVGSRKEKAALSARSASSTTAATVGGASLRISGVAITCAGRVLANRYGSDFALLEAGKRLASFTAREYVQRLAASFEGRNAPSFSPTTRRICGSIRAYLGLRSSCMNSPACTTRPADAHVIEFECRLSGDRGRFRSGLIRCRRY